MKQKGKGRKTVNKEGSNMGRCCFRRKGGKEGKRRKVKRQKNFTFQKRWKRGQRLRKDDKEGKKWEESYKEGQKETDKMKEARCKQMQGWKEGNRNRSGNQRGQIKEIRSQRKKEGKTENGN